jgi:hypothetical protein
MPEPREDLMQRARDFSWWMFSEEEIASLCNVPPEVVNRIKADPESPFFMDLCRPEWFAEWMRRHPDFQVSDEPGARSAPKAQTEIAGSNPWADARRAPGGQRER